MSWGMNVRDLQRRINIRINALSEDRIMLLLRDQVIRTYHDAINEIPQYSGYLASNLRIKIKGKKGEGIATDLLKDRQNWKEIDPKEKGDDYAIGIAAAYNRWFNGYKLSFDDEVIIKYAVSSLGVESGELALRDVNKPGMAIERAKEKIRRRYKWQHAMKAGKERV